MWLKDTKLGSNIGCCGKKKNDIAWGDVREKATSTSVQQKVRNVSKASPLGSICLGSLDYHAQHWRRRKKVDCSWGVCSRGEGSEVFLLGR